MKNRHTGLFNVLLFNWHYYAASLVFVVVLLLLLTFTEPRPFLLFVLLLGAIATVFYANIASILVTHYIYDRSPLYNLIWLKEHQHSQPNKILNIHAGFDETSWTIQRLFPQSKLMVFDFYNRDKHTAISIKRAQKRYHPYPGTILVSPQSLPGNPKSVNTIVVFLAAHEMRTMAERVAFFREIRHLLAEDGTVFVTEHLRDIKNTMAYTLGVFHFLSRKSWLATFNRADLAIENEVKCTPFITTFVLRHNEVSS